MLAVLLILLTALLTTLLLPGLLLSALLLLSGLLLSALLATLLLATLLLLARLLVWILIHLVSFPTLTRSALRSGAPHGRRQCADGLFVPQPTHSFEENVFGTPRYAQSSRTRNVED